LYLNQFDIYLNPIARSRGDYPFICALQNNLYQQLSTNVFAFVCESEEFVLDRLSAPVSIDGRSYHVCMNMIATFDVNRLEEYVGNIANQRDQILRAYDAMFTGI
jgi:hypothetical protein